MSEHEWVGSPTTASAWAALASPSDTGLVRLAFRDATDRLALASQLERWRAALARVPADVLVLPDIVYDAGGAILTFPTPAIVGANLSNPRTLTETITRLGEVAEALDALHESNVVHGALAGHSLWWSSTGRLRFPDAGLAHALEDIVGPPAEASPYRSPEFWHGQQRSRFSDQYALAVMAYEWITGHKREVDQSLEGVTAIEPLLLEPAALRAAGAPIGLADVLQRALSFTPTARYETCKAFVDELKRHTASLWAPGMPDRRKHRRNKLPLPSWKTVGTMAAALVVLVLMGANVDAMRRAATLDWLKGHLSMTRVEVRSRSGAGQARTPDQLIRGSLPGGGSSAGANASSMVPATLSRDSLRSALPSGSVGTSPDVPTVLVDVKDPKLDAARLLDRATTSANASAANNGTQNVSNGRIADTKGIASPKSSEKVPTLVIASVKREPSAGNTTGNAGTSGSASAPNASRTSGTTGSSGTTGTTGTSGSSGAPGSSKTVDPKAPAIVVLTVPKDSRVYIDGIMTRNTTHVAVAPGSHDITVLVDGKTVQRRVSLAAGDSVSVKFVP